ncbi:hypothetical protein Tsubulata_036708 [Turnera subulata]|uniref:DUF4283 domain-containing protein n=1 Tax=Turnera subulata TaxID=218843 RepID=A0A9Q0IZY4_9ROSI|nr:hypothetical protein Tsubulata_036708 [Turnera subulata]
MVDFPSQTLDTDIVDEDDPNANPESNGVLAIGLSKMVLLGRMWLLLNTPWSFANALLVVKPWPPHLTSKQIDLSKSCIWVQVHGLLLNLLNARNAEKVSGLFEGMHDFEITKDNIYNSPRIMRVKVEFCVDKPLPTALPTSLLMNGSLE